MSDRPLGAYIAYPIDQADLEPGLVDLIIFARDSLRVTGLFSCFYDPGDAFLVEPSAGLHPMVGVVNEGALDMADLVIAFLPKGVPSVGVPIEIDRAVRNGKWVIIVTDADTYSLARYDGPRVLRCGQSEQAVAQAVRRVRRAIREAPSVTRETAPGPEALPVLLGPGGRLPSRGYADDAGLDLYVVGNHTILPGVFTDVPCSVSVELPSWTWGLITGRSSTLRTKKLLVHNGIIDPGWRGELFAGVWNMGVGPVHIKEGERLAQLIILPNVTREFAPSQVDALTPHERGTNGFGSTGL